MLHWAPDEFWRASAWEVAEAYEGYSMVNGIGESDGLTEDDITELNEWMDEVNGDA